MALVSHTLVSRHETRLVCNQSSRYIRFRISGDLIAGEDVKIFWMLSYESPRKWQPIPHSTLLLRVITSGFIEFAIIFGPLPEGEVLENTCSLMFPPERAKDPFPELSYFVVSPNRLVKDGLLPVDRYWHQSVYHSGVHALSRFPTVDHIEVGHIAKILRDTWKEKFSYLPEEEVPRLTAYHIDRLIYVARTKDDTNEKVISRLLFHGDDTATKASVWRLFQNLMELVGRSFILRALFNAGQILIVNPSSVIQINTDFAKDPFVCYFRIPISLLEDTALVCELFNVHRTESGRSFLEKQSPTPYVTSLQIDQAMGDPFRALSQLGSVHHHLLKDISIDNLVQHPNIKVSYDDRPTTFYTPQPIQLPLSGGIDRQWWTRSYPLPPPLSSTTVVEEKMEV